MKCRELFIIVATVNGYLGNKFNEYRKCSASTG